MELKALESNQKALKSELEALTRPRFLDERSRANKKTGIGLNKIMT